MAYSRTVQWAGLKIQGPKDILVRLYVSNSFYRPVQHNYLSAIKNRDHLLSNFEPDFLFMRCNTEQHDACLYADQQRLFVTSEFESL